MVDRSDFVSEGLRGAPNHRREEGGRFRRQLDGARAGNVGTGDAGAGNDNSPPEGNQAPKDISLTPITLKEKPVAGTYVGTATAFDADGDAITYSLAGRYASEFAIDENTGDITVLRGDFLASEIDKTPTIKVIATDVHGQSVTSDPIVINITDANIAFAPKFFISRSQGTLVGRASLAGNNRHRQANTGEQNNIQGLRYQLDDDFDGAFKIDEETGDITIADSSKLDYNKNILPKVTVTVTDADGNIKTEEIVISLHGIKFDDILSERIIQYTITRSMHMFRELIDEIIADV